MQPQAVRKPARCPSEGVQRVRRCHAYRSRSKTPRYKCIPRDDATVDANRKTLIEKLAVIVKIPARISIVEAQLAIVELTVANSDLGCSLRSAKRLAIIAAHGGIASD